jgi:hypothetical protein
MYCGGVICGELCKIFYKRPTSNVHISGASRLPVRTVLICSAEYDFSTTFFNLSFLTRLIEVPDTNEIKIQMAPRALKKVDLKGDHGRRLNESRTS